MFLPSEIFFHIHRILIPVASGIGSMIVMKMNNPYPHASEILIMRSIMLGTSAMQIKTEPAMVQASATSLVSILNATLLSFVSK